MRYATHLRTMPNASPATTSYQRALDWLYAQTRAGQPRSAARMRALMEVLNLTAPTRNVHVVGTNGKGSVTAMVAAGLQASGRKTGRFMSPHVETFGERIAVDGEMIPDARVIAFVEAVREMALEPAPAFFELTLALALAHFAEMGVEAGVFEAGVGARHDATLALESVECVIITNVGRDHLEVLGNTVEAIARDKAEAIRPGVPVVTGASNVALEVVREVAAARGSPLFVDAAGDDLFRVPDALEGEKDLCSYRYQNQRLAAAALRLLGVGEEALLRGLAIPPLPGRGERFRLADKEVVLDGAHNPSGARALREALNPGYVLLFGALPKKLGEETLAVLEPNACHTFITSAGDQPITLLSSPAREVISNPTEALCAALAACPAGGRLVVTGSLYLAGELRPRLRELASAS
jgi:dihydrofolate synthase/folylpolyglutamate synthase